MSIPSLISKENHSNSNTQMHTSTFSNINTRTLRSNTGMSCTNGYFLENSQCTYDNTAPTFTIKAGERESGFTSGEDFLSLIFEFNEPVLDFTPDDVTCVGGELSEFSGSGKTYTAKFIPTGGEGEKAIRVRTGTFTDRAGNPNEAGNSNMRDPCEHESFSYDGTFGNCQSTASTSYNTFEAAATACNSNTVCKSVYESNNGKVFQQRYCSVQHQSYGWCNTNPTSPQCNTAQAGVTYYKQKRECNANAADWILVFRHTSKHGDYFNTNNNWAEAKRVNSNNPTKAKFSILDEIETLGKQSDGKYVIFECKVREYHS